MTLTEEKLPDRDFHFEVTVTLVHDSGEKLAANVELDEYEEMFIENIVRELYEQVIDTAREVGYLPD